MISNNLPPMEDLFLLPRGNDTFYLYSPLRRCTAAINGTAANIVSTYLSQGISALDQPGITIIKTLETEGFFTEPIPSPPVFPDTYTFCPHEVTLFPTTRCNLRCRYCYADAGKRVVDMPQAIGEAAINLVATNAGLLGNKTFALGFHGGGEPTCAWDFIKHSVDYAHRKADETGLGVEIFCASNGLFTVPQREYIAQNFTTINISLDGPADIQDHNRPKTDGSGSYEEIRRNLHYFNEQGFHYGIRTTITADTVGRMEEIVDVFQAEFNLAYLHMEPAWQCGRCSITGEKPPTDDAFILNFRKAHARGKELGLDIHYSGARLDVLTSKFCAAPGDGFSVLPEGSVTSCFEVMMLDDPRATIFHYGSYNKDSHSFIFDNTRLAALQKLAVQYLPFCSNCFCKWHCAGDCLAKAFNFSGSDQHQGSLRCRLNRELTLISLDELLHKNQDQEIPRVLPLTKVD